MKYELQLSQWLRASIPVSVDEWSEHRDSCLIKGLCVSYAYGDYKSIQPKHSLLWSHSAVPLSQLKQGRLGIT